MMLRPARFFLPLLLFTLCAASAVAADETGFKPIFDGTTLEGWKAPDMTYWSVEQGAITARGTEQHPVRVNQFLVWQQGELDDFELKLQFRITGQPQANSGVQFRSQIQPDGHVVGYQADIDRAGQWAGALYDEHGRALLAGRGHKTTIQPDGKKETSRVADPDALMRNLNLDGWNAYHITARGNHMTLRINGQVTAEVIDLQKSERELSGLLALQIHSGPPLTVQFKDIRLKRLPLVNQKKIVLVAGRSSHAYGSHEHRGGALLWARLLNENVPGVHAVIYADGWPQDPTALDNADALALFCDGGKAHVLQEKEFAQIEPLMEKGLGLACFHYALIVDQGRQSALLKEWIGGYYELFWSVNPFWVADFKTLPDHPITRGVRPFSIRDEWYYHMRFMDGMEGVTPILSATPPDSTRNGPDGAHSGNPQVRARKGEAEHVAWARQRPDGARGFGFTGGHSHWNWAQNDFRKIALNALVWIARAEVPPGGVFSGTLSMEEIEANLASKPPENWDREKLRRIIEE